MRTLDDIRKLLPALNIEPANELEDQDLDFKEWNTSSMPDAVALVIEMAVCMVNGGGGTVVFGVNDKAVGQENAILGVPLGIYRPQGHAGLRRAVGRPGDGTIASYANLSGHAALH